MTLQVTAGVHQLISQVILSTEANTLGNKDLKVEGNYQTYKEIFQTNTK